MDIKKAQANGWNPKLKTRDTVAMLPTPRASEGEKGGPNQRGSKGDKTVSSTGGNAPDAKGVERERKLGSGERARQPEEATGVRGGNARLADRSEWLLDWREVARETCWEDAPVAGVRGVDDGPAPRVYGPDRISEAAHRRERLKALGNAIVPAVAVEIFKAIRCVEEKET